MSGVSLTLSILGIFFRVALYPLPSPLIWAIAVALSIAGLTCGLLALHTSRAGTDRRLATIGSIIGMAGVLWGAWFFLL